ncbi:hypothetical protein HDU76_007141 [Blyttiomyces sp. JEL0837]|nr:hypothetical protein HDU76_007141 [Blyttiomyces sp. JEL0837]
MIMTPATAPPSSSSSSFTQPVCLWDVLPVEIREQIFKQTDIPTRFLNNQPLTDDEIRRYAPGIWITIVKTNSWDLDLTNLTNQSKYHSPTIVNGLDQITSRDQYYEFSKRRSDVSGVEPLRSALNDDGFWMQLHNVGDKYNCSQIHMMLIPKLLINIPMRQYWMDELEALNDLDQLKVFFVAGSCGHLELFQHLYNKLFTDQTTFNNIITSESLSPTIFSALLYFAAERGYKNIIEFMVTNSNINGNNKQPEQKPTLPLNEWITTRAMYKAFDNGDLDTIKLLLSLPNNDPNLNDHDRYMPWSVKHLHLVNFVLLELPGVVLKDTALAALRHASELGCIDTVRYLLDTFSDLLKEIELGNSQESVLFKIALKSTGCFEIVKMLMVFRKNIRG